MKYLFNKKFFLLLFLLAVIPASIFLSQRQQEIRKKAVEPSQMSSTDELKNLLEDVTTANGYGYQITDIPNRDRLDTAKIIESSPKNYLAVYHSCETQTDNCKYLIVKLAKSTDLANWYFVRDLFPAAQPTIAKLSNGGYLLVYENWHNAAKTTIKFVYYPDLNSFFSGSYSYQFDAPDTLSNFEGTPNIYSVTLSPDILHSQIQVGFHYYDWDKGGDRNAKATLTNFSSWSSQPDTQINNKLEPLGVTFIGDRDTMNFRGKQYALVEAATGAAPNLNWKIYLLDYAKDQLIPLNIKTRNGSNSFSNATFSNITLPLGMPGIVATHFIQDLNHQEHGELIFFKKYPSYPSGKVTDCNTGQGINGAKVLVFNNRNNPIATTLTDGTWASYETSLEDRYGVWPQCVSGLAGMPYNPPTGYLCNNSVGPKALSSPHKSWPGIPSLPNIGDYYDQALDGQPSAGDNSYNFCYTSSGNPIPTPTSTPIPQPTPTPTRTPTPTPMPSNLIGGKVTNCATGQGIPGIKLLVFNNRNNQLATTLSDGSWSNDEISPSDSYSVWPQCVSGNKIMPYTAPDGYQCNDTTGPSALNSPNRYYPGSITFPHVGGYYDKALDGFPSGGSTHFDFCYVPNSVPSTSTTQNGKTDLTFQVKLQGVALQNSNRLVRVILRQNGQEKQRFENVEVLSDANGVYTGNIIDILPGTYDLLIKGQAHLQKIFPRITIQAGKNTQNFSQTELLTGDLNNDNRINAQDLALLTQDYQPKTSPNSPADLNLDGVVNAQDIRFIIENYRLEGDE